MLEMKWKVLVVVDDSAAGKRAVDCAVDLCLAGFDSKLYLLYIKDMEPILIPSEKEEKKLYRSLRAKARKTMLDIAKKLKKAEVDFEVIGYHFGIAAEEIERVERKLGLDMIIIGAQKLSLFSKLLGGHYSEKTIFETKTPVLVVKPEYKPKIKLIEASTVDPVRIVTVARNKRALT